MAQRILPDTAGGRGRSASTPVLSRAASGIREAVMPSAQSDDRSAPARRTRRDRILTSSWASRLTRLVPRLLLIAAILLLASAVAFFAFRAIYADKVYPAVVVG
ncbi:MAG TPA: hypothetical protein VD789_06825, partial [Thermomicrobiales bacterium]|nr:hypothetical protein [Thermomicrobiales bacterium]